VFLVASTATVEALEANIEASGVILRGRRKSMSAAEVMARREKFAGCKITYNRVKTLRAVFLVHRL
jgi:hypothetical protein